MKQLLAGIRKPNNEKGVTLIELLICIALLGIFIIVALRLFDNGVKNYTTEASKAESDASLRQAMDVILSDIRKSGAKATQYDENKAEHTYTFKGQTNTDGHLCVIKFENSQIKITFDSNEITLLGSVYDFYCDYDEHNAKLDITIVGVYKNSNNERYKLTSTYYFRER